MKPKYFLIGFLCWVVLASCGDDSKSSSEQVEATNTSNAVENTSAKDPKKDKSVVNNFSSLESAIFSNTNYVWRVNKTIQTIRSEEDAKAADAELKALVVLSQKVKEWRVKYPELADEAKLMKSHQMALGGLAISRQSLNGTIKAKKNSGVYPFIESYVDQILENTPNPYGLIGSDE